MLSYMKSWRNHQKCFGKSITLNFPSCKQEEVWLLITIYFCFFSFGKKRLWMPAKCFSNVTKTSHWKSHSFRNGAKNLGENTWVPWKARFSSQTKLLKDVPFFVSWKPMSYIQAEKNQQLKCAVEEMFHYFEVFFGLRNNT